MENIIRKNIKAIQRINDGKIIEAGRGQYFVEYPRSYGLWHQDGHLIRRIAMFRRSNIGFVFER